MSTSLSFVNSMSYYFAQSANEVELEEEIRDSEEYKIIRQIITKRKFDPVKFHHYLVAADLNAEMCAEAKSMILALENFGCDFKYLWDEFSIDIIPELKSKIHLAISKDIADGTVHTFIELFAKYV